MSTQLTQRTVTLNSMQDVIRTTRNVFSNASANWSTGKRTSPRTKHVEVLQMSDVFRSKIVWKFAVLKNDLERNSNPQTVRPSKNVEVV